MIKVSFGADMISNTTINGSDQTILADSYRVEFGLKLDRERSANVVSKQGAAAEQFWDCRIATQGRYREHVPLAVRTQHTGAIRYAKAVEE